MRTFETQATRKHRLSRENGLIESSSGRRSPLRLSPSCNNVNRMLVALASTPAAAWLQGAQAGTSTAPGSRHRRRAALVVCSASSDPALTKEMLENGWRSVRRRMVEGVSKGDQCVPSLPDALADDEAVWAHAIPHLE
jgi:hypothetical protein